MEGGRKRNDRRFEKEEKILDDRLYMTVEHPREFTEILLALMWDLSKLLEIFIWKNEEPRIANYGGKNRFWTSFTKY